jgi:RNA polymerase sigma factor (sigma-70 family)
MVVPSHGANAMSHARLGDALDRLRTAVSGHESAGLTDAQLLDRYVARRDEAAFEALVRRHGPMVLGVCRRVLGSPHDAEDAFQATFLVLVRKAASVRPRERVGNWLYGVAYRAAQKARVASIRRQARESRVRPMPEPASVAEGLWHDLVPLLDRELAGLPEKYRLPVVLCELEGKTRGEVARRLGWPEGTVASRLARGRDLLARRLTRHGVPLSAGVLAAVLSQNVSQACVPATLVVSTVRGAVGKAAAPVLALAEGVLRAMFWNKFKFAAVAFLAVALTGLGAGLLPHRAQGGNAAEPPAPRPAADRKENSLVVQEATVEGVDAAARTVTLTLRKRGVTAEERARAKEALDRQEVALRAAAAAEEKARAVAVIPFLGRQAMQRARAAMAEAEALAERAKLLEQQNKDGARLERLPLAEGARITVRGKEAKLSDLKAKMAVTLRLAAEGDQLVVAGIAVKD